MSPRRWLLAPSSPRVLAGSVEKMCSGLSHVCRLNFLQIVLTFLAARRWSEINPGQKDPYFIVSCRKINYLYFSLPQCVKEIMAPLKKPIKHRFNWTEWEEVYHFILLPLLYEQDSLWTLVTSRFDEVINLGGQIIKEKCMRFGRFVSIARRTKTGGRNRCL